MGKRLLDLFCGAGGAAMGYFHSGFTDILGIDINPQRNYPFDFIQADALNPPVDFNDFDLIHASPPCQRYTTANSLSSKPKTLYPDLLTPTREMLKQFSVPYVIENVPEAMMRVDIMLCGTMFGLRVFRHRWFEISPLILILTPPCNHNGTVKNGDYYCVINTGGQNLERGYTTPKCTTEQMSYAMGIDWMTRYELTQAIPPMYTEFIGKEILQRLSCEVS